MERYELRALTERDLARVPEGADEALAWAEAEGVTSLLASLWAIEVGEIAPATDFDPAWPDDG